MNEIKGEGMERRKRKKGKRGKLEKNTIKGIRSERSKRKKTIFQQRESLEIKLEEEIIFSTVKRKQ